MTERSHEKTMGSAVEEVAIDILPDDAALMVIDVQQGFDSPDLGPRNNPRAEENCARLLGGWRRAGLPVFHVRHLSDEPGSPLRAGQPGAEFKDFAMPLGDEDVIEKRVNSAFIGTDLETRLGRRGISTLVLAGLTTDHCVSTTARMAGNLGFDTHVVGDATATFDRVGPDGRRHGAEEVHALALASLHGEFATVLDTETVLRLLPEPRSRAPGGAAGGGPSWQPTGVPGEPAEAFDPHPE
jgi:nicotinamidase-related amidase